MSDTLQPPVFFSLGDTRIVPLPFNSFFCSELTLEANTAVTGASVYLITDTPPLTNNSFTFSTYFSTGSYQYEYWSYFLYPGSNFSTSVRVIFPRREGIFYLIKGYSNFQQFVDNPQSQPNEVLDFFSIPCLRQYTHQVSFQVQEEDDYYLVYQARQTCTSRRVSSLYLSVRISVSRFLYSTAGLTNAPQCSAPSIGQCSLNVPNDPNYRALIAVTAIPRDNTLGGFLDINLHCSSSRGWAYAVVVLVPLLLVVGVINTTAILLVVRRRDSLRATCCRRHNTQTTTTEAATTSAVELQEMESQGPQQPAADQKDKTTSDSRKDGQQHRYLTAAPPPSYKDSLDYPTQKPDLPPPYYCKE